MKNLFQNKKILFTLILMASCLGILGVGEKGKAAGCGDMFCMRGFPTACKTADQWCIRGGLRNPSCSPVQDCWFNAPFGCTEPQTLCLKNSVASYQWYCKSSWGTCECDRFVKVATCDDQCCKDSNDDSYSCVNGKCEASETCADKGGACCDLDDNDCNNFTPNASSLCQGKNNYCCNIGSCHSDCEFRDDQVCCDTKINKCDNVIYKGPRKCSSGTCCQKESCVPKTTTGCTSGECNYSTKKYCDGGTWSSSKYCNNCDKNEICGDGDCNCGETTISCSADCEAPPASIVPVISQPSPTSGEVVNNGGGDFEDTGGGGAVSFINPLSTNSFEGLIMGIINWILGIVVSLAILFLIIGGLMYIVSAGDEERIKKAKNIIMYAVIGLGVVILSWSIITELKDILGVVPQ